MEQRKETNFEWIDKLDRIIKEIKTKKEVKPPQAVNECRNNK